MKKAWLPLLALALVSGCQRGESGTKVVVAPAPDANAGVDRPSAPTKEPTKDSRQPAEPAPTPTPPLIAKPNAGGWSQVDARSQEVAKRADDATLNLKATYAESAFTFVIPEGNALRLPAGKGQSIGFVRAIDRKRYNVQYLALADGLTGKAIRSDGARRLEMTDAGWKPQPGKTVVPADAKALVDEFPLAFPKYVYGPLFDGSGVWTRLVDAWSKGVGGYTVRVEEKSGMNNGKPAKVYRLFAETKQDRPTTIEAVFDERRHLPVAVRVEVTDEAGKVSQFEWRGWWAFDVNFPPESLAQLTSGVKPEDVGKAPKNAKS
ncbi:MAG: hypothetical protein KIS66_09900 [Fimbriimonadaceae bacterium]|nr:hypothetical protein [Fimbriimonadaceae bacterium]